METKLHVKYWEVPYNDETLILAQVDEQNQNEIDLRKIENHFRNNRVTLIDRKQPNSLPHLTNIDDEDMLDFIKLYCYRNRTPIGHLTVDI